MRILYCSAYYEEGIETGANVRFREIGVRLQNYADVTVLTPSSVSLGKFQKHRILRFIKYSRLMAAIEIFVIFKVGKYDALISDLAPNIPAIHSYFMIHDLRQFTQYRRHQSKISSFLYLFNLRLQRKFITVSEFTKSELQKYCSRESKIIVSYNGVNPVQKPNQKINKSIDILYVATFEDRKNHQLLINALSLFQGKAPNFKCLMLGRDLGTLGACVELINAKGLSENIELIESCTELELTGIYQKSRIFVSPSQYEGFGIPLIEAASHGLEIVCSDIPVFRELMEKKFIYFKSGSIEDLYDKLLRCYDYYDDGNDGGLHFHGKYDWNFITKKLFYSISEQLGVSKK